MAISKLILKNKIKDKFIIFTNFILNELFLAHIHAQGNTIRKNNRSINKNFQSSSGISKWVGIKTTNSTS